MLYEVITFVYPETPFFYTRSAIAVNYDCPLRQISTVEDLFSLDIGVWVKA